MKDYPNLNMMFDRYTKAINSGTKEIRFSTIELGNILQDITKLSISVTEQNTNSEQLKKSVDMLVEIISQSLDDDNSF